MHDTHKLRFLSVAANELGMSLYPFQNTVYLHDALCVCLWCMCEFQACGGEPRRCLDQHCIQPVPAVFQLSHSVISTLICSSAPPLCFSPWPLPLYMQVSGWQKAALMGHERAGVASVIALIKFSLLAPPVRPPVSFSYSCAISCITVSVPLKEP